MTTPRRAAPASGRVSTGTYERRQPRRGDVPARGSVNRLTLREAMLTPSANVQQRGWKFYATAAAAWAVEIALADASVRDAQRHADRMRSNAANAEAEALLEAIEPPEGA